MCKDKEFKKLKRKVRKLEKDLGLLRYKTPNIILEKHYVN